MISQELIDQHAKFCNENLKEAGEGPWSKEPHRVEFNHAGLDCLLSRHEHNGHWCGYVGLPPGHPYFGKSYDDVALEVHGGVTYANPCKDRIRHFADNVEDGKRWWLGWDFAHCGDLSPVMEGKLRRFYPKADFEERLRTLKEHYWTVDEVMEETKRAAERLAKGEVAK